MPTGTPYYLAEQRPLPAEVHTTGAVWCPSRAYRFVLYRLDGNPDSGSVLCAISLNPSSADEYRDDATVQQCWGFARRGGFTGLLVLNVMAVRGSDPDEVLKGPLDPVGVDNDAWIRFYAQRGSLPLPSGVEVPIDQFILSCGNLGATYGRAETVARLVTEYRDLYCLGTTQKGLPRHPSRLAHDTPITLYRAARRNG